jgi:uncharacterized damage-inducible protein DinB
MTPEPRTDLVEALEKSRQELQAAVANVDEEHASVKPEPGRWSVLECVEHVAVVEERFLGRLQAAPRLESPRVDEQKEAELAERVPNRTTRAEAPEPARPTGRFSSLAEALGQFDAARDRTIRFAQDRAGDLYWLALEHPRFGPLNGAEFIVVIAGHARRHAAQIQEVKSALGIA